MPTVGADQQSFDLHGRTIMVRDGVCVASDGTLAGSNLDMAQSLRNLTSQGFGFRLDGALSASVDANFGGYGPEKLSALYADIDRRMRDVPGVRNAALALYAPMSGNNWQMNITFEERPAMQSNSSWNRVSTSFFDTIGARILVRPGLR